MIGIGWQLGDNSLRTKSAIITALYELDQATWPIKRKCFELKQIMRNLSIGKIEQVVIAQKRSIKYRHSDTVPYMVQLGQKESCKIGRDDWVNQPEMSVV